MESMDRAFASEDIHEVRRLLPLIEQEFEVIRGMLEPAIQDFVKSGRFDEVFPGWVGSDQANP